MADRLTLLPHQWAQANLSTGAGGFGMFVNGSMVATLSAVLANLSGDLWGRKYQGLYRIRNWQLPLQNMGGGKEASEEEKGQVVPRGWRDRAFRPKEVSAIGELDIEVLVGHDAETINTYKAQKTNSESRPTECATAGMTHLWTDSPSVRARRRKTGPFGETETLECAKAGQRSQVRPGVAAWLRARPVDASPRHTKGQKFMCAGRQCLGIEKLLAATCPACGGADANT